MLAVCCIDIARLCDFVIYALAACTSVSNSIIRFSLAGAVLRMISFVSFHLVLVSDEFTPVI